MIKRKSEQKTEERENMRGGAGKVFIRHHLNSEDLRAKCRLCAELTLPAGSGIGLHEHAGEDEVFIVRSGSGIVTDGDKEYSVNAGDVIVTGNNASHSIKNNGSDDLVVTAVIMQY